MGQTVIDTARCTLIRCVSDRPSDVNPPVHTVVDTTRLPLQDTRPNRPRRTSRPHSALLSPDCQLFVTDREQLGFVTPENAASDLLLQKKRPSFVKTSTNRDSICWIFCGPVDGHKHDQGLVPP